MNWFTNRKSVVPKSTPVKNDYPVVNYHYSAQVPTQSTQMVESKSMPVYTVDMLAQLQGSHVSAHDAMGVEAFYSCIQDQSGAIGALPVKMYRMGILDKTPERIRSGQIFNVIADRPNEYQGTQEFLEMVVTSYRTNGAFYAVPFYDSKGRLSEIIPFANQSTVKPNMDINGQVYYTYTLNNGQSVIAGRPDQLFIVKGMTLDGYTPIRPLTAQAQLMGIAMDQEDGYANLQANGITSQMALGTDNLFDNKDARMRLKEDFAKFRGPAGRKEIPILEQGLKPIPLNLTPQEMDLLNQREFTVKRICAVTETMPHRIGAETLKTSDKIYELDEAQFKKWNPLIKKIEDEFSRHAGRYITVKLDRTAFYEGSPVRLAESVERQFRNCMANLAEAREMLGLEYIPGTEDIYAVNTNNITLGKLEDIMNISVADRNGVTNNEQPDQSE